MHRPTVRTVRTAHVHDPAVGRPFVDRGMGCPLDDSSAAIIHINPGGIGHRGPGQTNNQRTS
jgi:hypothetical protein